MLSSYFGFAGYYWTDYIAGVVRASGRGRGVSGERPGRPDRLVAPSDGRGVGVGGQRAALARWGRRLGAGAGADYLKAILAFADEGGDRPAPPWILGEESAR